MDKKKIMQEIWKEALKLPQLPELTDSFFDLGGNSFIASKVIQIYEEQTGETIELDAFYENECIDELVE